MEDAIVAIRAQPRFWRHLVGCCAIYVLVLHGILAGLAGAHMAGQAMAGHELCLHDAGDAGADPGQPSDDDHGGHCLLCVAVAHGAVVPTRAATLGLSISPSIVAFWPIMLAPAARSLERLAHRTRAPPVVA